MPTRERSRQLGLEDRIQAHRIDDNTFRVYNPTKNTSYTITRSPHNFWHCECPFMTKGSHVGTEGVCKHITRILDKLKGCGKGEPGSYCRAGRLCASCRFEERMQ